MSQATKLAPPHLLMDYRGAIKVVFAYDDVEITCRQAVDFIQIPEAPVFPRIKLCAIDDSGRQNGTLWTYDPEMDHGRGAWITYDERIHAIPSNQPLVDAGTDSHQLEPDDEVESSEETAPISLIPPSDDEEKLDEPSDEDEDDEDDVTAD